ncbi:hypothetical protein [Sphingomonas sp.]|uniref:hypothetical protein n=1 Tax=Sphingomonas sp. TaxID=28214 RepID=UPI002DEC529C|nr:hypothetical protein [Sphingomonas sp.]
MSKKPRLVPSSFGQLPVRAINAALDLELDAGETIMSVNAQFHARKKHPEDFARCFPHVAAIIGTPLYARDDFRNEGKIELIGKPAALGEFMLVAVEISVDDHGRYNVTTFYPVSEGKVAKRREAGHLKRVYMV